MRRSSAVSLGCARSVGYTVKRGGALLFQSRNAGFSDGSIAVAWGLFWAVACVGAWGTVTRISVSHGRLCYFYSAVILGVALGSLFTSLCLSRFSPLAQLLVACFATGVSAVILDRQWVWPWSLHPVGMLGTMAVFLAAVVTAAALVGLYVPTRSSTRLRRCLASVVIVLWFALMAMLAVPPRGSLSSSPQDSHFLPPQLPQSLTLFLLLLGPAAVPPTREKGKNGT